MAAPDSAPMNEHYKAVHGDSSAKVIRDAAYQPAPAKQTKSAPNSPFLWLDDVVLSALYFVL
jgi:hypothetical protein